MNLSELFIRRPVMTILLNAAIVLAGVIGYRSIPVSALPSYDTPVISVTASLPGASAVGVDAGNVCRRFVICSIPPHVLLGLFQVCTIVGAVEGDIAGGCSDDL